MYGGLFMRGRIAGMADRLGPLIGVCIFVAIALGIAVLIRNTTEHIAGNGIRFSLRTLLITTTVIALALALASAVYTVWD